MKDEEEKCTHKISQEDGYCHQCFSKNIEAAFTPKEITPPSQPEASQDWEINWRVIIANKLLDANISPKTTAQLLDSFENIIENLLSTQRKEHKKEFKDFITQLKKIDNIDNKLREVEQKLSKN